MKATQKDFKAQAARAAREARVFFFCGPDEAGAHDAAHHILGLLPESGKTFEEIWQARADANPARRYGRPAELGAYCAFLCSIHAGYITGQNLLIDGGSYPGTF